MAFSYLQAAGRLASAVLVGGLIWSATGAPAAAQLVPSDQILNTLAPQAPATRSLTAPAVPAAISDPVSTFVEGLRHRTRSLTVDEADHVAEIAKDRAKIDLEVNFDFNSSAITAKAEPQLKSSEKPCAAPSWKNR